MPNAADRALFLLLVFTLVGTLLSVAGLAELGLHWLDRHVRFRLRRWQCELTIIKWRCRLRFQQWLESRRTCRLRKRMRNDLIPYRRFW